MSETNNSINNLFCHWYLSNLLINVVFPIDTLFKCHIYKTGNAFFEIVKYVSSHTLLKPIPKRDHYIWLYNNISLTPLQYNTQGVCQNTDLILQSIRLSIL